MSAFSSCIRWGQRIGIAGILFSALMLTGCSGDSGASLGSGVAIPQNVVAHAGSGVVTISWDAVTDADSYTVYWDTSPGVSHRDNVLLPGTSTNIAHTGLTNGLSYYYRVSATVAGVEGNLSDEQVAKPTSWSAAVSSPLGDNVNAMAWNGTRFVAVGANSLARTSTDGDNWSAVSLPVGSFTFNDITWSSGQSLFVTVGSGGDILYSSSGTSWTDDSGATSNDLHGVTANSTTFVTVGQSETILLSADPTTTAWTAPTGTVPGTTNTLNAVAWSGSLFAAVGQNGFIVTSSDGASWTQRGSGVTTNELRGIIWADEQFVAVGDSGTILTSPDGLAWTLQTSGVASTTLYGVFHDGGLYLAVGSGGVIVSSADGVTWTEEVFAPTSDLFAVSGDATQDIVAGSGGVVYARPQ